MIANLSRISTFNECRRKAWNWAQLGLTPHREADPLIMGGAVHEGLAEFLAHRNPDQAVALAESQYRDRLSHQIILPEERPLIEQQIEVTKRMVRAFTEHYSDTEMQVIWPEVEFLVPLPNTAHHCWFAHRLLHPDIPFAKCKFGGKTFNGQPRQIGHCYQPHYFRGKTDAVVSWRNAIWLLEHKTSAYTGDIFYDRFWLDFQPTGYLYGIGKAMGTTPHGFILNVLKKPQKDHKKGGMYRSLDINFEREFYLRSDEDLQRFERELIMQCEDYEAAFRDGRIYMNTKSCTAWNRRCYYWNSCKRNEILTIENAGDEFRIKDPDYVDLSYFEILGLPVPEVKQTTVVEEV